MSVAMQRDVGAYILAVGASNPIVLNSSVGGDEAEINGFSIDRELVTPGQSLQLSCQAAVQYSYSLAAAKVVVLHYNMQHSSAASSWLDYADKDGSTRTERTVGTTASTGAQTGNGTLRSNFDLSGAKRYVRLQIEADFTGAATDDMDIGSMIVFGGYDTTPASTAGV